MVLVCIISSVSNCGRGNFAIVYRTMHFVVSVKLCLCSALSFFQAYLSVLFFRWDTSQFSISFPNFCCHEDICGRSKPLRFVVLKHSDRSSTDQFISKQLYFCCPSHLEGAQSKHFKMTSLSLLDTLLYCYAYMLLTVVSLTVC